MRRLHVAALTAAFGFLAIYACSFSPWFLAYNRTDSIPTGWYFAHRGVAIQSRDELVCFRYHEPGWARGRYLPEGSQICKEVLGLPGDTIIQTGAALLLKKKEGGTTNLGEILVKDSRGRSIPPQEWGTTTIPAGHYYLGSTRVHGSFDSRYLGLIEKTDVLERIFPLITF